MPVVVHLRTTWGESQLADACLGEGDEVLVGRDGSLGSRSRWSRGAEGAGMVRVGVDGAAIGLSSAGGWRVVAPGEELELTVLGGRATPYRASGAWRREPLVLRVSVAHGTAPRARPRSRARAVLAVSALLHLAVLGVAAADVPALGPPFDAGDVDAARYFTALRVRVDDPPPVVEPALDARVDELDDVCRDTTPENVSHRLFSASFLERLEKYPAIATWYPSWPAGALPESAPSLGNGPSERWDPYRGLPGTHPLSGAPFGVHGPSLAACFPSTPPCSRSAAVPAPGAAGEPMAETLGIGTRQASEPQRWWRRPRLPVRMRGLELVTDIPASVARAELQAVARYTERCWHRALQDEAVPARELRVEVSVRANVAHASARGGSGSDAEAGLRCCVERAHDFLAEALPTGATVRARYRLAFGGDD